MTLHERLTAIAELAKDLPHGCSFDLSLGVVAPEVLSQLAALPGAIRRAAIYDDDGAQYVIESVKATVAGLRVLAQMGARVPTAEELAQLASDAQEHRRLRTAEVMPREPA